ncbi:hypothetical protein Clacol_002630 [Clathrus columnatus]|uniref:Uncharacterized protein n=1 Tax=Clathrus columnatus TaxID=1419009 RepID=A0AAV5A1C2_9AGAM|nr:hypothetical protein Clacol_002630 [Clathrus columnatus]
MADKYNDIINRISSSFSQEWSSQQEHALLEPYTYLTTSSGKEIRKKMIEAFNIWLKVPEDTRKSHVRQPPFAFSSSPTDERVNLHRMDDVEDDSQLRRGQPVAHKIYGIPQTVNSANYVYFLAYKELFALRDTEPKALELDRLVTDELLNLHRGQGLDLLWRDSLTCPTEEEYIHMIRDDYMNLQSGEYESNKGFAEDLTEGKFSFPIVHSIRADSSNRQVLNVLQKRPSTPTTKRYVIQYMRSRTNSFEYTLQVLRSLEMQARKEIERLGGNVILCAILDQLTV